MFTALLERLTKPRRRRNFRGARYSEDLEPRQVLSWSAIPATFGWASSTGVTFSSNANSGTAAITNNEVDVYNFVAPRTGTYTIAASANGSRIDTVLGVYNWQGNRLAGNDDISSTNRNSQLTVWLQAGVCYAMAITNYTGGSNGGYSWSIDGPPLSISTVTNNQGGGVTSSAFASVRGNNLNIFFYGFNNSNFTTATHRVDVYLLDSNNRPIHSGSWWAQERTGGTFVPGIQSSFTRNLNFNLASFDLRNLAAIRIVVR